MLDDQRKRRSPESIAPVGEPLADSVDTMPRVPAKKGQNHPGTVGENLLRLRKAAKPKISRAKLAKMAGVASSTISNVELGYVGDPGMDTIRRLAKALGVTAEDLVRKHGRSPLDQAIEEFKESDYSKNLPGGPVTSEEYQWLAEFPHATWEVLPPNPVALHYIILSRRSSPKSR